MSQFGAGPASGLHGRADDPYEDVSLVAVLANPKAFDGHRVRIGGYLTLRFEGNGLHLDEAAFASGLKRNSIWVDQPNWLPSKQDKRFDRRYAEVAGVFDASAHGHMGAYSGQLRQVQEISLSLTEAEANRMTLGWIVRGLAEESAPWLALFGVVAGVVLIVRKRARRS